MSDKIDVPLRRFKTLLVVDLEATCDNPQLPREEMETIEFGGVLVRVEDLQRIDERTWFIKPTIHTQLTAFCRGLTSITQEQVDTGVSFAEASAQIAAWLEPHREQLGWGSWGNFDMHQLEKDGRRLGMPSPLAAYDHENLKVAFTKQQGIGKKNAPGLSQALALCGLSLEGAHHRGIDDARNVARLLPWILDPTLKGKINRDPRALMLVHAMSVLGSKEAAERWMEKPALGLNGQRPIDLLVTREGKRMVIDLLMRMEHCVYT